MHATTTPGFSHASVERLCDYELPEPKARPAPALPALPALSAIPLLPDARDAEKLALSWWLWMDEMNKSMWRPYDAWREQHLGQPAGDAAPRGRGG